MKFGKDLHGVMNMSHPDWAPYWPNYKLLKKQIKKLPSIPSSNNGKMQSLAAVRDNMGNPSSPLVQCNSAIITINPQDPSSCSHHQRPRDGSEEAPDAMSLARAIPRNIPSNALHYEQHQRRTTTVEEKVVHRTATFSGHCRPLGKRTLEDKSRTTEGAQLKKRKIPARINTRRRAHDNSVTRVGQKKNLLLLRRTTEEVAFFKLLHGEVRKAHRFFHCTERQLALCNARVLESAHSLMLRSANQRARHYLDTTTTPAMMMFARRKICHLYRQLVSLESYAIMSYVAFSKILKKHDKVTGHATRHAFMRNIVQKASFANYPGLMDGMERCRKLFYRVSDRLDNNTSTTKNHRNCTTNTLDDNDGWPLSLLRDDQRLFVSVVQKLKHGSDRSSREDDD